jgi:hypothetical protein
LRKLLRIVSRPGAVVRLLRQARQAPAEAVDSFFNSEEGLADSGALSRYPSLLQVQVWRRIRATTRSPVIENRAVQALVDLKHPPDDLIPYLWQCMAEGRIGAVDGILTAYEPRMSDEELETILRAIERGAPAEERCNVALTLLCMRERTARLQRFLEATGLWEWRGIVPRDCGAVLLTRMFPSNHALTCDLCHQHVSVPRFVIGPRATVCSECLSPGLVVPATASSGCVLCGHAGPALCSDCTWQVETLRQSWKSPPPTAAEHPKSASRRPELGRPR